MFLRPSIGAIHEIATPHPTDAIAIGIAQKLAPEGKKQDCTGFYGFDGGTDINFTKHFALRVQADLVRDRLFNDLLREARNSVRFSTGPAFQWGRNLCRTRIGAPTLVGSVPRTAAKMPVRALRFRERLLVHFFPKGQS